MASRADSIGVSMVEREEGVIAGRQRRRQPGRRSVACETGCRPSRSHVIRIRGPGKVRLVAVIASRRRTGKNIVDVTEIACNGRVGSGQWEGRVVVVEGCSCPVCSVVARVAGGGKARRSVRRVIGAIPIRLMAAITSCGNGGVVIVHMTLHAR